MSVNCVLEIDGGVVDGGSEYPVLKMSTSDADKLDSNFIVLFTDSSVGTILWVGEKSCSDWNVGETSTDFATWAFFPIPDSLVLRFSNKALRK